METSGVSRLMQLSWGEDPDPRVVVPLLRLYLRRAARWAIALGCEDAWPFFDIAARACPGVRAPENEVLALASHLRALLLPERVVQGCIWALHWEHVRRRDEVACVGLDDPFEPLLAIFELGGTFTTVHGWVDVGGAAFRLGRLTDHFDVTPSRGAPS